FPIEHPLTSQDSNFTFLNLKGAIQYARQNNFDLVIAMDTIWDKLGIAVRKSVGGDFQILTVHQVAALLTKRWVEQAEKNPVIFVKSIHISDMVQKIVLRDDKEIESLILEKDQLRETVLSIASEKKDTPVLGFTENQEF